MPFAVPRLLRHLAAGAGGAGFFGLGGVGTVPPHLVPPKNTDFVGEVDCRGL